MDQKNIFRHEFSVSKKQKEEKLRQKGMVYWLTGLSGSGKSTIANEFEKRMHSLGISTILLDGDNIRSGLCKDLGFSPEDRKENIRRIAEVCRLNSQSGLVVISAFISPFAEDREMARKVVGEDFVEVFVDSPLGVCELRDTKGLYKKARNLEIKNFTGISSPWEAPKNPELHLDSCFSSVDECVDVLFMHYAQRIKESGLKRDLGSNDYWPSLNHGNNKMNLTEKQHAVFIGRFQPLHHGHVKLFRQKLDLGIPLLILVRDLVPDKNNPFTTFETIEMINKVFKGEPVVSIPIPDIESVNWGRGVGYELNEYFPPEQIGAISATQVRNSIQAGMDDWKAYIDPVIHDYVLKRINSKIEESSL